MRFVPSIFKERKREERGFRAVRDQNIGNEGLFTGGGDFGPLRRKQRKKEREREET